MESKIIEAAKGLFMEKGYVDTSMSDIAARMGINRPVLHYYFRTKDRLFQAIFGMIIQEIVPIFQDIITARDISITERITNVVDAYYEVFRKNPLLPLFVVREIDRDVDHIINAINNSPMSQNYSYRTIAVSLRAEMAEGKLNTVPLSVLFYTFYGAMTFPFLAKKLSDRISGNNGGDFDRLLEQWKPYVIKQMEALLCVNQQ